MSAKLYVLQSPKKETASECLRRIAYEIDHGMHGEISDGALVFYGNSPAIFSISTDALGVYYILGRAMRKLEQIDVMLESE